MRRVVQKRDKSMKRMRSVKKYDVFMCSAGGFQSVGAKTLNESNTFEKLLKPQNKFERCMCVRKLEIWFW